MAQNANFSPTRRGVDPLVDDDHPLLILRVFIGLLSFFLSFQYSARCICMVFRSFVLLRCTCLSCRLFWVLFPRSLPSFLFFCLCLSLLCSISPAFFFCCFSALSLFILSILHSSLAFFSACVNLSVLSLFFRLPSSPFCFSSPSLFSVFALPPLSLSVSSSSPLSFFLLSVSFSLSPFLPLSSSLLFSSLFSFSPPLPLSLSLSTIPLDVHFP